MEQDSLGYDIPICDKENCEEIEERDKEIERLTGMLDSVSEELDTIVSIAGEAQPRGY